MSKKKHAIVLDLDSTLVHSGLTLKSYPGKSSDPRLSKRLYRFDLIEGVDVMPVWGVLRPYTLDFIDFCRRHFDEVIVWSAGQHQYVHKIVDFLFKDAGYKPRIILTREHCRFHGSNINKPLSDLFDAGISHPEHTLALDDRYDTFSLNVGNGIKIPNYDPDLTIDGITKEDDALVKLMSWLILVKMREQSDIRQLPKDNIFDIPMVTYRDLLKQQLS